ncbi:RrF2 family transcriptional regulator [Clostridium sp.]|uniref:RrF2 family transcriptional regulator n=1 Tax=Clostridium sp. TaxID=1506 RepID=UPI003990E377
MQLSKFTDYSFRALIYLAENENKLCTIDEIAKNLNISEHHLKKIINKLAKTEYIISIKGRNGGLKLGISPSLINLGSILKITEDNLNLVECFGENNNCSLCKGNICKLNPIISSSLEKFFQEFSKYTLADII